MKGCWRQGATSLTKWDSETRRGKSGCVQITITIQFAKGGNPMSSFINQRSTNHVFKMTASVCARIFSLGMILSTPGLVYAQSDTSSGDSVADASPSSDSPPQVLLEDGSTVMNPIPQSGGYVVP